MEVAAIVQANDTRKTATPVMYFEQNSIPSCAHAGRQETVLIPSLPTRGVVICDQRAVFPDPITVIRSHPPLRARSTGRVDPAKGVAVAIVAVVVAIGTSVALEVHKVAKAGVAAIARLHPVRRFATVEIIGKIIAMAGINRAIDINAAFSEGRGPTYRADPDGVAVTAKDDPVIEINPFIAIHMNFAPGTGGHATNAAASRTGVLITVAINPVVVELVTGFLVQNGLPATGVGTIVPANSLAAQAAVLLADAHCQNGVIFGAGIDPVHVDVASTVPGKAAVKRLVEPPGGTARKVAEGVPIGAAVGN